jgi:dihydroorotate dehydrogenase electron transfer subunit
MKKYLLDLEVVEKKQWGEKYVLLGFSQKDKLPPMFPGQFVEVRVDNAPNTYLRRPISVYNVDIEKNILWLYVQVVGEGTQKMLEYAIGDIVNILLPLGNNFSDAKADDKVALVGGGVGVAPLLYYGIQLKKQGIKPHFVLGARSSQDLVTIEDFKKIGDVYVTTEDASLGEKGYVTQHSFLQDGIKDITRIVTCGPDPMMRAVAKFAQENEILCEASLENHMACGFGVCLCCVTPTTEGHKCVCTDGPVFNVNDLEW